MDIPSKALRDLAALRARRSQILATVLRHLEEPLRSQVVTAGLTRGRLTLGVASAAWASRLRYRTSALRGLISADTGEPIARVRIRVLPPSELPQPPQAAAVSGETPRAGPQEAAAVGPVGRVPPPEHKPPQSTGALSRVPPPEHKPPQSTGALSRGPPPEHKK